jgi:acetolactate synthase-1/2/3 large subunit
VQNISTSGADIIVATLAEAGVKVVFCITGAGNLAIVDALVRNGSIKIVFSHHEQAAVMEAQGYARVSGEIGVALVTTGGGTSNVTTGVLSAHLDSIPILIISGNESSFHCENIYGLRAYGVQGYDSVATLKPITKNSQRISKLESIREVTACQISLALENRKGPTHIDFPMDLQRANSDEIQFKTSYKDSTKIVGTNENEYLWLAALRDAITHAKRPLLYIGNGVRFDLPELLKFIESLKIPFLESWSAIDLISEDHPLKVGRVGIYGDRAANIILQQCDVILTLGTRLSIPQTGYDKNDFARKAKKWVVDIDESECQKFAGLGWEVLNSPASNVLSYFNSSINLLDENSISRIDWLNRISLIKKRLPRLNQIGEKSADFVHSVDAISRINESLDKNAVVVTDVGAGLLSGHYVLEKYGSQRIFTSQGLGEMGFGLPGAIGAYFADSTRQLVCLNTDGAIMFNLQELQVVNEHKIPMKLFIFNNSGYSMIKISQTNLFDSRLSGSSTETGLSFPDFELIANTFGMKYSKMTNQSQLNLHINEILASNESYLIEVIMSPNQRYLPRLSTIKLADGSLMSPPLEDLEPLIELEELAELLGYDPNPSSYKIRGLIQ